MAQKSSSPNFGLSPRKLGYRMRAEWELHEATWLSWPRDLETWPKELNEIESIYVKIIKHLYEGEKVRILIHDSAEEAHVRRLLLKEGIKENIFFHEIPTDSPWIRDYGPTFVTEKTGRLALINWVFNAWGKKYAAYERDDAVPSQIAESLHVKEFQSDLVMEGGAIEVNGAGTCLVTEQCLLNPNRNPSLGQKEIEQVLKDFLDLKQIIWLGEGIAGDDTDGHVDEIARFVSTDTICAVSEENSGDENFSALRENKTRLSGNSFRLVLLPMPEKIERNGKRYPASYANFYIGNKAVLVPIFGQKTDAKALGILRELFPDRKVVGMEGIPLVYGQGAFHCITQQQPAASV